MFTDGQDGPGQTVKTNLYPSRSARIETYAKDVLFRGSVGIRAGRAEALFTGDEHETCRGIPPVIDLRDNVEVVPHERRLGTRATRVLPAKNAEFVPHGTEVGNSNARTYFPRPAALTAGSFFAAASAGLNKVSSMENCWVAFTACGRSGGM